MSFRPPPTSTVCLPDHCLQALLKTLSGEAWDNSPISFCHITPGIFFACLLRGPSALQEPRGVGGGTAPKRASCLIIGRHPHVPREVRVICKQLTGRLQLGECCQHLTILAPGNELMSPPEFEAAAGCSKGKNWKARLCSQAVVCLHLSTSSC